MSRIKSKNTKPEILVRKFLHSKGFRFRLNDKRLPGKPDIVLPKYKTVILINGCFWHGHNKCKYYILPKTRIKFWRNKIEGTIKRDSDIVRKLKKLGWRVIIIWECKLKPQKINSTLNKLSL